MAICCFSADDFIGLLSPCYVCELAEASKSAFLYLSTYVGVEVTQQHYHCIISVSDTLVPVWCCPLSLVLCLVDWGCCHSDNPSASQRSPLNSGVTHTLSFHQMYCQKLYLNHKITLEWPCQMLDINQWIALKWPQHGCSPYVDLSYGFVSSHWLILGHCLYTRLFYSMEWVVWVTSLYKIRNLKRG